MHPIQEIAISTVFLLSVFVNAEPQSIEWSSRIPQRSTNNLVSRTSTFQNHNFDGSTDDKIISENNWESKKRLPKPSASTGTWSNEGTRPTQDSTNQWNLRNHKNQGTAQQNVWGKNQVLDTPMEKVPVSATDFWLPASSESTSQIQNPWKSTDQINQDASAGSSFWQQNQKPDTTVTWNSQFTSDIVQMTHPWTNQVQQGSTNEQIGPINVQADIWTNQEGGSRQWSNQNGAFGTAQSQTDKSQTFRDNSTGYYQLNDWSNYYQSSTGIAQTEWKPVTGNQVHKSELRAEYGVPNLPPGVPISGNNGPKAHFEEPNTVQAVPNTNSGEINTEYGITNSESGITNTEYKVPYLQYAESNTGNEVPYLQSTVANTGYGTPSYSSQKPITNYQVPRTKSQEQVPNSDYGAPSKQWDSSAISTGYGLPTSPQVSSTDYGISNNQWQSSVLDTGFGSTNPPGGQSTKTQFEEPSMGYGLPSKQYNIPSTSYGVPEAPQVPSTKIELPSTDYGIPNTQWASSMQSTGVRESNPLHQVQSTGTPYELSNTDYRTSSVQSSLLNANYGVPNQVHQEPSTDYGVPTSTEGPITQQIKVPVPQPYLVPLKFPQKIQIPVYRLVPKEVEKRVPITVEKLVPIYKEKKVEIPIEKIRTILVPKKYPIYVPIYKHVYVDDHKKKHW